MGDAAVATVGAVVFASTSNASGGSLEAGAGIDASDVATMAKERFRIRKRVKPVIGTVSFIFFLEVACVSFFFLQ